MVIFLFFHLIVIPLEQKLREYFNSATHMGPFHPGPAWFEDDASSGHWQDYRIVTLKIGSYFVPLINEISITQYGHNSHKTRITHII